MSKRSKSDSIEFELALTGYRRNIHFNAFTLLRFDGNVIFTVLLIHSGAVLDQASFLIDKDGLIRAKEGILNLIERSGSPDGKAPYWTSPVSTAQPELVDVIFASVGVIGEMLLSRFAKGLLVKDKRHSTRADINTFTPEPVGMVRGDSNTIKHLLLALYDGQPQAL